ncbi:hypothetical protein FHT44_005107 [Mycolicibacterium sp. BK634]|uniref:hypothetical protein n=1 Tax=Mycolicibacterium sp. BK634 TaxID=2587099 RepID=UPI001613BD17|nr:hypothetical protein [Mycolicibacterium sp. BK634]MBB3752595.1 hypothetical protein [Mycolicibacterium sp. BK634]
MRLLAHQIEIVEAINNNFVTSISAPRQNGKSYAALAAAIEIGGRTLFVSQGFAAAKCRFTEAERYESDRVIKACRTNGELSVIRESGTINFLAYSKYIGRGMSADTLILDDADFVDNPELIANLYPVIATSKNPRIVALGILPDRGLAAHFYECADKVLHWYGDTEAKANPALGTLISEKAIEREKQVMPPDIYRRDRLGLYD